MAHCPCSNMRLASGIAPVSRMIAQGVPVGLGVDGSASNDGGHMLGEARQAMLLQRVRFGPAAMTARGALELGDARRGRVLNRDDIGPWPPTWRRISWHSTGANSASPVPGTIRWPPWFFVLRPQFRTALSMDA